MLEVVGFDFLEGSEIDLAANTIFGLATCKGGANFFVVCWGFIDYFQLILTLLIWFFLANDVLICI